MHSDEDRSVTPPGSPTALSSWYSYAIVRVVPRVERGECVNVGVVLFAREASWLDARIELDAARVRAITPDADIALIERHLHTFLAICAGSDDGGPIAALPPSERFHWLTAPRSTIIQTAPVHVGTTDDPARAIEELMDELVRLAGEGRSLGYNVQSEI